MSLFASFYRDRKSEEQSSLEPFLTHSLTYILRQLARSQPALIRNLAINILLASRTMTGDANQSFAKLKRHLSGALRWESQEPISSSHGSRYPDIRLYARRLPVVVIEAKTSARLTPNQLESYGKWLARQHHNESHPPAALVFLTHVTSAPEGFLKPSPRYGVPLRAVCSWMEIHNFLFENVTRLKDLFDAGLVKEFCAFMAEHELNGMTPMDTQFLAKLLSDEAQGVGAKINPLFEMIRKSLRPQMEKEGHKFWNLDPWGWTEGYAL